MGTFTASLRSVGDVRGLPATVELEDGRLSIAAGSTEIGSWPLSEITLEPIPTGYRMAAEGEQILIELKDIESFREALDTGRFKRRFSRVRGNEKEKRTRGSKPIDPDPSAISAKAARVSEPGTASRLAPGKTDTKKPAQAPQGIGARIIGLVDSVIHKANKRFGPYLPEWAFSRAMFFIGLGALILLLVFPGPISVLLVIAGGIVIALGAVAYSDPIIASRWLPGRTSPPHVLIIGVATLLSGVLLGMIAP
jgi:hypothetical protein